MVTEAVVKHEFIVQTIQWGLDKLRRAQIEQLNAKRSPIEDSGFNWDALVSGVAGRQDGVIGSNGRYRIVLPIDRRLRFADMKRLGGKKGANAAVYNRPTWGVFFGRDDSVRTRLRTGISEAIRESVLTNLRQAIEQKP
ncbi:MAG: hypothetical protein IJQ84_09515 [Paludibacteraceae bacterium]|nr:hypothetical protein [Paludibacteraceae bacterium]